MINIFRSCEFACLPLPTGSRGFEAQRSEEKKAICNRWGMMDMEESGMFSYFTETGFPIMIALISSKTSFKEGSLARITLSEICL